MAGGAIAATMRRKKSSFLLLRLSFPTLNRDSHVIRNSAYAIPHMSIVLGAGKGKEKNGGRRMAPFSHAVLRGPIQQRHMTGKKRRIKEIGKLQPRHSALFGPIQPPGIHIATPLANNLLLIYRLLPHHAAEPQAPWHLVPSSCTYCLLR